MILPRRSMVVAVLAAALAGLGGCGSSTAPEEQALLDVKTYIQTNLDALLASAEALQAAAPAPDADGWNATDDAAAVAAMKAQWKAGRIAYESIEGAIAVLFPDLDVTTDQRYDAFLAMGPDDDLFDGTGVTGNHGIERILWADSIRPEVVAFESTLTGYHPAAFPANATEASEFKTGLCARFVSDIKSMRDQFAPLALDPAAAYRGVIGSMGEQVEKATLAATGEEESRYANFTLGDMKTNVAAGVAIFAAFRPWLRTRAGGTEQEAKIDAAFQRVQSAYDALSGDSLPPVPATWSSQNPSAEDLATPFGQLYGVLLHESDPDVADTLVSNMDASADLLGIAQLP